MKRQTVPIALTACVLIAALISCTPDQNNVTLEPIAKPSKASLRVMSFNIRYGDAKDDDNSWPNRKDMVCNVIAQHKPDVVGMQEALLHQIETIVEDNPKYKSIGVGREDGKNKGEFSNILYRKDRYHLTESGTFWLSDTPEIPGSITWGNACTRICTWVRLVDDDNKGFYFYNVHLDHRNQNSREKSVVLVSEKIKNRKHPKELFILTGDFNAGEKNSVILYAKGKQPIKGASNLVPMVDTFRQVHPDEKVVGTFGRFNGAKNGAKIDYIFVDPRYKTLNANILYTNTDGRYPSDHYPIIADIQR